MWLDGEIVPEDEARVSVRDRGFLDGDGCFETVRLHRGVPFRIAAHLGRLGQSLEILRFEGRWSADELRNGARKVVDENRVEEGLVRITVTAGDGSERFGTTVIGTRTLPEIPRTPALHVATSARRMSGPLSQCKSIARAAESIALREARAEGAFDAILLNERGRAAETTARNLFAVIGSAIRTPPPYEGALSGITRGAVLEMASRLGLKTREASMTVDALLGAEEVFLSGSGVGILGVASIDGHRYRAPGSRTQELQATYAALLDAESKW